MTKKKKKAIIITSAAVLAAILLAGAFYLYLHPRRFGDVIGHKYEVRLVRVMDCPPIGEYKVSQGAASDGKYAYFLMRKSDDSDGVVVKYDLETHEKLRVSEPFHTGHGNDMTYDSHNNYVVVAHGSSEGKILTLIDADTLEVKVQSQDIPKGAGAVTYNVDTEKYAISQGGKTLFFLTQDYELTDSFDRVTGTGYVAQGMGSDDKYIYFPMSPQNGLTDNILQTYDWNGKYIGEIHIPTKSEAETCYWVNDTFYISFYMGSSKGATLYRAEFVRKIW